MLHQIRRFELLLFLLLLLLPFRWCWKKGGGGGRIKFLPGTFFGGCAIRRCSWTVQVAICLNHFVLIDVCSAHVCFEMLLLPFCWCWNLDRFLGKLSQMSVGAPELHGKKSRNLATKRGSRVDTKVLSACLYFPRYCFLIGISGVPLVAHVVCQIFALTAVIVL